MREFLFWLLLLVGMAPVVDDATWLSADTTVTEDGSVTASDGHDGPPPHK